jgi:O-antigen chain-terminating methyltransferase
MSSIEIRDPEIDAKKIVEQIKTRVRQRRKAELDNLLERRFYPPLPISEDELKIKESLEKASQAKHGWDVQVRQPILSNRPIISRFLIRIRKILQNEIRWTIDPILEKQIAFNLHFSENVLQVLNGLVAVTNELRSSFADLQTSASILAGSNLDLADRQDEMSSDVNDKLFEVNSAVSDVNHKLTELKHNLERHDFSGLKIDYAKFQDEYRGAREEIIRRQAAYVRYFKGCKSVLDLGCGRGEFLELLKHNGIGGYGIDVDEHMVGFCRSQGLDARKVDVLSHLRSLEDECLDGVFSAQIVEHMLPADLLEMIALSYRKLKPGGFLVAETVNPGSLYTFSHAFYVDLTHVKPIHPEALLFLLRMNGFRDVKAEFSSPPPPEERLQTIPVDTKISNLEGLNENLRKLNDAIWGPQDYAAIGKK